MRASLFVVAVFLAGCSTVEVPPDPPAAPLPPILAVPHPAGADLADVRNLFYDKEAPPLDSLKSCDGDFRKLEKSTQSRSELDVGIHELIQKDPVAYHWCFYSKLLSLENDLRGELYVDERQKRVLEAFEFLTPVARAFLADFRDSRYLRWAIFRYQKLSEWVFFQRVEPSPKETEELVNTANPLGLVRSGANDGKDSVLDRYGIGNHGAAPIPEPAAAASANPAADSAAAARAPAADSPPSAAPVAEPAALDNSVVHTPAPGASPLQETSPANADFQPFQAIDPSQLSPPPDPLKPMSKPIPQ